MTRSPDTRPPESLRMAVRCLAALGVGLVAGLLVVLALLAFEAAVEESYVHAWTALVGWHGLPMVVAPTLLTWAALRLGAGRFWRSVAVLAGGGLTGAAAGAVLGAFLAPHPSAPWAGGLMGAGGAVLLVGAGSGARALGRRTSVAMALTLLLATCRPSTEPAPGEARVIAAPDPDSVEAVVFLMGDPGMGTMDDDPVLPRMREDVESWSRALGPGGTVAMVVLGDLLYPEGLHAAGSGTRAQDSLRLTDQIRILGGPDADSVGARGFFVPGNHDWGEEEDWAGAVRLERIRTFLQDWRGPGAGRVSLHPAPGRGGPDVVDLSPHLRLVLLDTAWWLLGREPGEREAVLDGIRGALESAGDRRVILAAHHPLESGGPHGAGVDLGSFLGIRLLLKKAGILLQDLDSRPYAGLRRGLLDLFREAGRPDLFVGGHEHSLQVFDTGEAGGVRGLVVGSASKLTDVGGAPGMLFGRSEPGYAKIFVLRDGSLHLRIESAPARFLDCSHTPEPRCLEEGMTSFRTVWSEILPSRTRGGSTSPP